MDLLDPETWMARILEKRFSDPDLIAEDAQTPGPAAGFYYLVRGRNVCGDGTYGRASDGTSRASAACP